MDRALDCGEESCADGDALGAERERGEGSPAEPLPEQPEPKEAVSRETKEAGI